MKRVTLSEQEHSYMRRSKLELYEEILNALAEKSLTVDGIAYQCNMDCVVLGQRLNFLLKNGLIEQNFCNKKLSYALTKKRNRNLQNPHNRKTPRKTANHRKNNRRSLASSSTPLRKRQRKNRKRSK